MEPNRDALLRAMEQFDRDSRGREEWIGWEANQTHKYAISYEGRLYPVKKVVSLATGIPVSDFSGGAASGQANSIVQNVGLDVVNLGRIEPASSTSSTPVPDLHTAVDQVRLEDAQTVGQLATAASRFFLKSEWGPLSEEWPALSFSKRSVGEYLVGEYKPGRDFILYAGTGDPERTEVQEFRKRLLSVVITEPGHPIPTERLVPASSWRAAIENHGKSWPYSFIARGWRCVDLPPAREIVPIAYRALGVKKNWGGVVEIEVAERDAVLSLRIEWVQLPYRPAADRAIQLRERVDEIRRDPTLNAALTRMQQLIQGRLGIGRTERRALPDRSLPPGTDLISLLHSKLRSQGGLCALCGQPIPMDVTNPLLQCSPDRIDSKNPSYGEANLQITHLACNWAKNDGTTEEFEEWLQMACGN